MISGLDPINSSYKFFSTCWRHQNSHNHHSHNNTIERVHKFKYLKLKEYISSNTRQVHILITATWGLTTELKGYIGSNTSQVHIFDNRSSKLSAQWIDLRRCGIRYYGATGFIRWFLIWCIIWWFRGCFNQVTWCKWGLTWCSECICWTVYVLMFVLRGRCIDLL